MLRAALDQIDEKDPLRMRASLVGEQTVMLDWIKATYTGQDAGATPRTATYSGGWAVAYDRSDLRSAYGVAGEHLVRAPYSRVFGVFFNGSQNPLFARIEVRSPFRPIVPLDPVDVIVQQVQ